MQKKLIALAIAGLSSVAFAQSNVTVYGVADVAVAKEKNVSLQAGAAGKFNNGDSRLGFMGSEDLGGGLKVNFKFEQGINIATGAVTSATVNDEWNRGAWVGLSGGFGELRIGREYTAGFYTKANWELSGYANYSAVVNVHGWEGGGPRNNAQALYMSPSMGGFKVYLGHILKQNAGGVAQTDLGLVYANGPISAGFAYADNGNGNKDKSAGLKYDLGMAKVAVGFYDPNGTAKGWSLGAGDIKAGPMLLTIDYAKNTDSDKSSLLLEGKYPLSKRTFVYVAYRDDNNPDNNFLTAGMRHNF